MLLKFSIILGGSEAACEEEVASRVARWAQVVAGWLAEEGEAVWQPPAPGQLRRLEELARGSQVSGLLLEVAGRLQVGGRQGGCAEGWLAGLSPRGDGRSGRV